MNFRVSLLAAEGYRNYSCRLLDIDPSQTHSVGLSGRRGIDAGSCESHHSGSLSMTNASTAPVATPTDLDESATMTVADALKIILANSYAVYLKTKNFHWHVSGPYFRDYHLLLDEQAAEILAVTDAIAERARKTGNRTLTSIGDIARHQTIKDNDAEFVTPQEMLGELRADNLHMVEAFRRAKEVADEAKDNATSGLIDAWTDEAERRAWFLFEASRPG